MYRKHYLFITLGLCLGVTTNAQNLLQRTLQNDTMPNMVLNPGFEESQRLYCGWTQDVAKFNKNMTGWSSPTQTTPDHFSSKNEKTCWAHPSEHSGGKQSAHSGDAMIGIKTYGKGNTPTFWHEYVQAELPNGLVAGTRYIAEFWALRAVRSNEASNNIGIVFADAPISTRDCLPLYITPVVNEDKLVKGGWQKVTGVFDATGNEKYLLIGNFYGDEATAFEKFDQGERGAYYYIDDVNVRIAPPGTDLTPKPKVSVPPAPKVVIPPHTSSKEVAIETVEPNVGTRLRLDNVQFEFDKAVLLPGYEDELQKLVDMLMDYPFLRAEIEGHTDDEGTDEYNLKLSNDRAKAVADHLIKKKVDKDRITWKGYGESKPLVANSSDANKAINRRVEFQIIER